MSEWYYWLSIPLGVSLNWSVPGNNIIHLQTTYSLMLLGQMKAIYPAYSYGYYSVRLDAPPLNLGIRPHIRMEAGFQHLFNNRIGIRLTPFAEYYGFGESNRDSIRILVDGYEEGSIEFFEPESRTFLYGIKVNAVFALGSSNSQQRAQSYDRKKDLATLLYHKNPQALSSSE
jgi:hypothetical protein